MRIRWVIVSVFLIFFLLLTTDVSTSQETRPSEYSDSISQSASTQYYQIEIIGNYGFQLSGFPGTGTVENPYIISGIEFESDSVCVSISQTTVYFVIKDCRINCTSDWASAAILFEDVTNGKIERCDIYSSTNGISLIDCGSSVIQDCYFVSQQTGLLLVDSESCRFESNVFEGSGVSIRGENQYTWIHSFLGNLVNGLILGYLVDLNSETIDIANYGQLILVNCSNILLRTGGISNVSVGLTLAFCTDCLVWDFSSQFNFYGAYVYKCENCTIQDSSFYFGDYGVIIEQSTECILRNVKIRGGTKQYGSSALRITNSKDCEILNCNFSENYYGSFLYYTERCTVQKTIVFDCYHGISVLYAKEQLIDNNTLYQCYDGLEVEWSMEISISNNRIEKQVSSPLSIYSSNNSIIVDNWFNSTRGFTLHDPNDIIFVNNTIRFAYDADSWIFGSAHNFQFSMNTIIAKGPSYIHFDYLWNPEISWNVMQNCSFTFGLSTDNLLTYDIHHNSINGKPLLFIFNQNNVDITSENVAQIFIFQSSNVRIRNCEFENIAQSITFYESDMCLVEACAFSNIVLSAISITESNVTIDGCSFIDCDDVGVAISLSQQCLISDCEFTDCGLQIRSSHSIDVQNCDFNYFDSNYEHHDSVIYCDTSSDLTFINCYHTGQFTRFIFTDSDEIVFDEIYIEGGFKIDILGCHDFSFLDSNLGNMVLYISAWDDEDWIHEFSNVTSHSKKIGYFRYIDTNTIDTTLYSQLYIISCNNTILQGQSNQNIVSLCLVDSWNCTVSRISFTSRQEMSKCICSAFYDAFRVLKSPNCLVEECDFSGCGLFVRNSQELFYNRNSILGFWFSTSLFIYDCNNSVVSNNILSNTQYGISIISSNHVVINNNSVGFVGTSGVYAQRCNYLQIENNHIQNSSRNGLDISMCNHFDIKENVIFNIGENGIQLSWSNDGMIQKNRIYFSNENGIYIKDANNVTILRNAIGWSSVSNACEIDSETNWDDGLSIGNYWNDYEFGQYLIEGDQDTYDKFPTYLPNPDYGAPIIEALENRTITIGTTGNEITWIVDEDNPTKYKIYLDNILVVEKFWDGSEITYILDNLTIGRHNLTLKVYDLLEDDTADTVYVDVRSQTSFVSPEDIVIIWMFVIGIEIVAVVLILFKRRKAP